MPRTRPETIDHLRGSLGNVTLAWTRAAERSPLTAYAVKHGVFHLLEQGRAEQVESRMLDLPFMANFADSWPTVVEPLSAWRAVGTQQMLAAFVKKTKAAPIENLEELWTICDMIRRASLHGTVEGVEAHKLLATASTKSDDPNFELKCARVFGEALLRKGHGDEAKAVFLRCIRDQQRTPSISMLERALTLNELAVCNYKLGSTTEAKQYMAEAVALMAHTPQMPLDELLILKANLGYITALVEQRDQGLSILRATYDDASVELGSIHPKTIEVFLMWLEVARLHRAEPDLEALKVDAANLILHVAASLGRSHDLTMRLTNDLGLSQMEDGEWAEAYATIHGIYHLNTHLSKDPMLLMNIAVCCTNLGRLPEAKAWFQDALQLAAHLPPHHQSSLLISRYLAGFYTELGEHNLAITTIENSLERLVSDMGRMHPSVGDQAESLAFCLMEAADADANDGRRAHLLKTATESWRLAIDNYAHVRGETHKSTLRARYKLGKVLNRQAAHSEALREFEMTLSGEMSRVDKDHPNLAPIHWNIATCLRKLDRPVEASTHRRRCWEMERRADGPAAASTLQTAHALAEDLLLADRLDDAMSVVAASLTSIAQATDTDDDRTTWTQKLNALYTRHR